MNPIRIAVHGAAGRMGRRLVALGSADEGLSVVAALESAGHPQLGEDAGVVAGAGQLGVALSSTLDVEADVVIDFSLPEAVEAYGAKEAIYLHAYDIHLGLSLPKFVLRHILPPSVIDEAAPQPVPSIRLLEEL